jgi:hypothetical protein
VEVREAILESFDVERIDPVTLLFQSGYLTIKNTFTDLGQMMFRLGVPNTEVKVALNDHFINAYTALDHSATDLQRAIRNQLLAADLQGLVATVKRLFAAIPWRNFTRNGLADAEGYYASVLYAFFSALDARVIPEDISNDGQVDLTVRLGAQLYLIEIKVLRRGRNAGKRGAGGPCRERTGWGRRGCAPLKNQLRACAGPRAQLRSEVPWRNTVTNQAWRCTNSVWCFAQGCTT